jgi:DNA recombination protein RmuC
MNPIITSILFLALGVVLGLVLGRVIGSKNPSSAPIETELRNQLESTKSELNQTTQKLLAAEKARSFSEAEADLLRKQHDDQRAQFAARAEEQRVSNQQQLASLKQDNQEQVIALKNGFNEQLMALKEDQLRNLAQMKEAFGSLSADALAKTQPQFLALINETMQKQAEAAKGDLAQRQESIAGLLKPVETMLKTTAERAAQSETTFASAMGDVKKHLETLAAQSGTLAGETLQLRKVLGSNQARGAWGEETLRRVVEASGMSVHCDFTEQAQSDDKKPDMIVRLPGDRMIIVDSKVPDLEFLNALHDADESKRAAALKSHVDKLKQTIKELAGRDYPSQFPSALDHVVLFLPAESLFSAALEGDRELIIWAAQRNIMLATPASLIALLRSVSISWQQHEQAVNAREIAEEATELFSRVATLTKHFANIGAGIAKAGEAYNDAVGSYGRSVRPQGERLVKLGIGSGGKELAEAKVLDFKIRQV